MVVIDNDAPKNISPVPIDFDIDMPKNKINNEKNHNNKYLFFLKNFFILCP